MKIWIIFFFALILSAPFVSRAGADETDDRIRSKVTQKAAQDHEAEVKSVQKSSNRENADEKVQDKGDSTQITKSDEQVTKGRQAAAKLKLKKKQEAAARK